MLIVFWEKLVFTIRCLDKKPYTIVVSPPQEISDLTRIGRADWNEQSFEIRDLCELALFKVKERIRKRCLYLEPIYRDFDK